MLLFRPLSSAACVGVIALAAQVPVALACTSLLYQDTHGSPYAGRTLELPEELPYVVSYTPAGTAFGSEADHHHALDFTGKHPFVSIGIPDFDDKHLKVIEGLNDQGLTFSLLAFPSTEGPADMSAKTQAVLAAIDLGAWTLSQFGTVAEVKEALEKQPVLVTNLLPFGAMKTPFHYTLHDATGKSIVIEYANGEQNVYDNPLGVMTNGPAFPWHVTNMNNYTHLANVDHSQARFHGESFTQPDSGIATAGLPASNTSVGRFVRAVYYSQFAEKARDANEAITTLGHVMNNFDRPRGITMDSRLKDAGTDKIAPGVNEHEMYTSEYTTWTTLTDLKGGAFFVRTYDGLNYVRFSLDELANLTEGKAVALKDVASGVADGSTALQNGRSF